MTETGKSGSGIGWLVAMVFLVALMTIVELCYLREWMSSRLDAVDFRINGVAAKIDNMAKEQYVDGVINGARVVVAMQAKGIISDKIKIADIVTEAIKIRGSSSAWMEERIRIMTEEKGKAAQSAPSTNVEKP